MWWKFSDLVVNGMANTGTVTRGGGSESVSISFQIFNHVVQLAWTRRVFNPAGCPCCAFRIRTQQVFHRLRLLLYLQISRFNRHEKYVRQNHYYKKPANATGICHWQIDMKWLYIARFIYNIYYFVTKLIESRQLELKLIYGKKGGRDYN